VIRWIRGTYILFPLFVNPNDRNEFPAKDT
jgi:hypothetical protein